MKKFFINTDGGARNNPGPAASSFVISNEDGRVLLEGGKYLGVATNNDAEYTAVRIALEALVAQFGDNLPAEIEVKADSLLIVNQLSGLFKIKNDRLRVLFSQIKLLEEKVGSVNYTYIPREKNKEADALVNKILDEQTL